MSNDANQQPSQTSESQQQTDLNSQTDAQALATIVADKAAAGTDTATIVADKAAAPAAPAAGTEAALAAGTDTSTDTSTNTNTDSDNADALATAGTDANKGTGGKEDGNTSSDSGAPESYSDFDLPDGVEMNKGYMDKMGPLYKEFGLTQEQAQKLITAQVGYVQEGEAGRTNQVEELHKSWLDEAKADKDIGGDNFDSTLKAANLAVNKFGGKEFKTLLRSTGLGNHPEIIRVFSKIGSLLKEDVPGDTKLSVVGQKLTTLQAMYPDDQPKEVAA